MGGNHHPRWGTSNVTVTVKADWYQDAAGNNNSDVSEIFRFDADFNTSDTLSTTTPTTTTLSLTTTTLTISSSATQLTTTSSWNILILLLSFVIILPIKHRMKKT